LAKYCGFAFGEYQDLLIFPTKQGGYECGKRVACARFRCGRFDWVRNMLKCRFSDLMLMRFRRPARCGTVDLLMQVAAPSIMGSISLSGEKFGGPLGDHPDASQLQGSN